jgi:small multidrug resistance pump
VIWVVLVAAIAMEVAATASLKPAGRGDVAAIIVVGVGYVGALTLLAVVVQTLEVGVVYAVWSGVGTALVVAVGIFVYDESLTILKLVGLALIIGGVVALNVAT